jgi:hypothetical protein
MKQRAWMGVGVAVAVAVAVLTWSRRGSDPRPAQAPPAGAPIAERAAAQPGMAGTAAPPPPPPPPPPPTRVTRLGTATERQQIVAWIAAARAARAQRAAASGAGAASAGAGTPNDLEHAPAKLQAALGEAIPFLAECYKTGSALERRPAVQLTLIGDPEVGTLVDADRLAAPGGKPLDPELEGCLRTTLASLELPPLGGTEPLHIEYSFRFDDE